MSELLVGELLLELAGLLLASYLLGGLFSRWRIPVILAALFVAMAAHYTPLGDRLTSAELYPVFTFLGDLGVMFLLFFIGLQIDLKKMKQQSSDIVWLTVLNTSFPFLMGVGFMLSLGYGWLLSVIVGLTRMPTAEAVIVPILDDFELVRSRVGRLIIGTGVLDDIIEVFLVALVSIWIGERAAATGIADGLFGNEVARLVASVLVFATAAIVSYKWLVRWLSSWLAARAGNLVLLCMVVLFGFSGLSEFGGLGMVVGAIVAGVIARPTLAAARDVGDEASAGIRSLTYGFFGLLFFFWVGLSVDLAGLVAAPLLTVGLYGVGTIGKLLGALTMVPLKRMNLREAVVVGVGIDARLTTEVIVAKLLLDTGLIDAQLFTALVAAASVTALSVPLLFSLLVARWGDRLRSG